MSFICPNCGYRDDPRWRNRYWDTHVSFMSWDDFQTLYPAEAEQFREGKRILNLGPYIIQRTPVAKASLPKYILRGTPEVFKSRNNTLHIKPRMEARNPGQSTKLRFWPKIGKNHVKGNQFTQVTRVHTNSINKEDKP